MIWVLSSHYCTDAKMVPLIHRISWVLAEKVRSLLDVETVFRRPVHVVLNDTKNAQHMLEVWKRSYMETRKKIEESGKGQRWEFDRKLLFGETDFMACVCRDLHEVANVSVK